MKKLLLIPIVAILAFEAVNTDPPFGLSPRQVISLFQDERRNEGWDMAIIYGRYLINEHPREMESVDSYEGHRTFRYMVEIYQEHANMADDQETQEAYLDSALQMFDRVYDHYDEDELDNYRWTFNKGRFYHENSSDIEDGMDKAYAEYERLLNMDPERFTQSGDGYYVEILFNKMKNDGRDEELLEWMDRVEEYADDNLQEFFAELRNDILDDPRDRVEWLAGELEQDPGNVEIMEEMYELYEELGDSDAEWDMAERLYDAERNYSNTMRMAEMYMDEGNYRDANQYLEESLEMTNSDEQRYETTIRLARNHLNFRDFEEAREYAVRASNISSNEGEPYILIADIYRETVNTCSDGDLSRHDRTVYWLALDYLDQARDVDPDVRRSVENRYPGFEQAMPSASDKHFMNWQTGNSFRINENVGECYAWIDEQTTVR